MKSKKRTVEQIAQEKIELLKKADELLKVKEEILEKVQSLDKEAEEIASRPMERWKPETDQPYWWIDGDGNIWATPWFSLSKDKHRHSVGNCYKTRNEANETLERMVFIQTVADEVIRINNGWEPDWTDMDQKKWGIYLNHFGGYLEIDTVDSYEMLKYHFPSREHAQKLIDKFGDMLHTKRLMY